MENFPKKWEHEDISGNVLSFFFTKRYEKNFNLRCNLPITLTIWKELTKNFHHFQGNSNLFCLHESSVSARHVCAYILATIIVTHVHAPRSILYQMIRAIYPKLKFHILNNKFHRIMAVWIFGHKKIIVIAEYPDMRAIHSQVYKHNYFIIT